MKVGLLIAVLAFLGACSTPSYRTNDRQPGSQGYNQNRGYQFGGVDTLGARR